MWEENTEIQETSPRSERNMKAALSTPAGPEEGHRNGQVAGTPLLLGQAEQAGIVHPGEGSGKNFLKPFNI